MKAMLGEHIQLHRECLERTAAMGLGRSSNHVSDTVQRRILQKNPGLYFPWPVGRACAVGLVAGQLVRYC